MFVNPPDANNGDPFVAPLPKSQTTFPRGLFDTLPEFEISAGEINSGYSALADRIVAAMPHGLRDGLRKRVDAGLFVDTTSVHDKKREALAAHRSQKEWLDQSQGMDSYLITMDELSLEVGELSGEFKFAEGWRRHLHYGFSGEAIDPLSEVLGEKCAVNEWYEIWLDQIER